MNIGVFWVRREPFFSSNVRGSLQYRLNVLFCLFRRLGPMAKKIGPVSRGP